jgi:hypothetical protein
MRHLATLIVCAPLVLASVANAQGLNQSKPQSQADMQKSMDAAMGSMIPMMGRMAEVMIEAQLKAAARPETAASIATFKKNLYDELQKKGFTPEQALQITLATAPPAAAPMGK